MSASRSIFSSLQTFCRTVVSRCRYTKRTAMVPMRDGVKLYTAIYEPRFSSGGPILIKRTPFPLFPYNSGGAEDISANMAEYVNAGYIIVYQNVRGVYMSEGGFVDLRPVNPNAVHGPSSGGETAEQIDEATDAYDTIDWLLSNTRNNGRAGVFGVSYPGFYATMAAQCNHPALRAVSPQAPVTDWWRGDDAHHNGALMLSDMYTFGGWFFQKRHNPTSEDLPPLVTVDEDIYDYFLSKGPISEILRPLRGLDFMDKIVRHPDYDDFWRRLDASGNIGEVSAAVLVVGGLYDAEDCYGARSIHKALRRGSPKNTVYYVCGPWTHGGWRKIKSFREKIEYPFFAYYLEDKGFEPSLSELYITTGTESLIDGYDFANISGVRIPLTPGSYVSDPSDPVPYMAGIGPGKIPGEPVTWRDKSYMWADQRFLNGRKDVLTCADYEVKKDLLCVGKVSVHLEFSLDSTDADFIVKVIDEAPDGTMSLVRADVFPARYRKSLSDPSPVTPGEREVLDFRMCGIAHWFKAGHRIRIQVQSTWFPLVAASPQTFLANQYEARAEDYVSTLVTIHEGSYVRLKGKFVPYKLFNNSSETSFREHRD